MLVLKKISAKKLATYLSIILVMLGGTGFMLYQNQKLTNKQLGVIDDPARYEKFMTAGIVATPSPAAPSQSSANQPKTEPKLNQPLVASQIKNSQGLDLSIFSSQKFQELKENILVPQENLGLGKRDLFAPN